MTQYRTILPFLTCLLIASCGEEEIVNVETQTVPALFSSGSYEVKNVINVQRASSRSEPRSVDFEGQFILSNGDLSSNATLWFNHNYVCVPDVDNSLRLAFNSTDLGFNEVVADLDGKLLNLHYSVLGGMSRIDSIYSPENISVSFSQDILHLDKTLPLTVNWGVDENAPLENVFIAFVSRGVNGEVDDLTRGMYLSELTPDDGSYTFPASLYSEWPDDLNFDIIIGRGNQSFSSETSTLITVIDYNYSLGVIRE